MADADTAASLGPIDLSARAKLRFRGADRVRFLNGQVSNDVRRLESGDDNSAASVLPACVCSLKGKLDAFVYISASGSGSADEQALLVDGPPELRDDDALWQRFDRYLIADQVELDDVSEDYALWHFLPGNDRPDLPGAVWKKANRFGIEGHDLWLEAASAERLAATLGRPLIDPDDPALEALRISHRVPRWGAELGPDILPAEAGLDRSAVDFHKGCYTGQEVVSRIESVGRVNRSLCLLQVVEGDPDANELAPGAELFAESAADKEEDEAPSAKAIGQLTSIASDRNNDRTLALAYVRRGHSESKTRLVTRCQSAKLGSETVLEIREV